MVQLANSPPVFDLHLSQGPKTLSYNPAENALLITSDVDGGSFELYIVPKEAARGDTAPVRGWGCVVSTA